MSLYVIVAFLFWTSLYVYVPTLPIYIQSKSDNLVMVGAVISMYGLWQAVIRLPLGIVVDRTGKRKPFIIVGLILAALGAWIMGTANDPWDLLIGRSLTGFAAAAWVPLVVAFSSLFPHHEAVRATAILTFVFSSARVLATASTGSLNNLGGYPLAFFLAASAALLGILFILPAEEARRSPARLSANEIGRLITRRDVLLPALLAAVAWYAAWATIFGFTPILVGQLGGADMAQSMIVSMHVALAVAGNLIAMLVINRIGAKRLLFLGFGFYALGIGLAAVAPTVTMLFVAQFIMGLAHGANYPVLMGLSIKYVDDAERTTAMGLHQSVYAIGMFTGPWLSGLMAEAIGVQPMFGVTAFICLILGWFGISQLVERPVN